MIGFEIMRLSDKRKIQLFCKDQEEKEMWMKDIDVIVNGYLNQDKPSPLSLSSMNSPTLSRYDSSMTARESKSMDRDSGGLNSSFEIAKLRESTIDTTFDSTEFDTSKGIEKRVEALEEMLHDERAARKDLENKYVKLKEKSESNNRRFEKIIIDLISKMEDLEKKISKNKKKTNGSLQEIFEMPTNSLSTLKEKDVGDLLEQLNEHN